MNVNNDFVVFQINSELYRHVGENGAAIRFLAKMAKRTLHTSFSLFNNYTLFPFPLSLYFSDFVTLFFLFCLPPSLSNLSILQLLACIAMMRNVKDGAATTINCAVNPELNTQQCFYYSDCRPKEPIPIARSPIAIIMPTVLICAYKNSFVSMF